MEMAGVRSGQHASVTRIGVIQQRLMARVGRRTTVAAARRGPATSIWNVRPTSLSFAETAQLAGERFHDLGALRPDDSYGDIGGVGFRLSNL
jgi:hypothetical protein